MKLNDRSDTWSLDASRNTATSAIRRAYRHLGQGPHLGCDQPLDGLPRASFPPDEPLRGSIEPGLLAVTVGVIRQGYRAHARASRAVASFRFDKKA
jgi:hypothetical protein